MHKAFLNKPLGRAVPFFIAALPPLYLIGVVLTSTVDVPFADQWALVPLLDHSYRGSLTIRELWAQHNEHRLLFPRLIMLALAHLSGWNTHAEMLANIGLAACIWCLLAYQLRASASRAELAWAWLAPVLSLAVFSLNQAENWWGGWNIQIFLNVLAVSASCIALAALGLPLRLLALAIASAVIATYSYSNGLLIWPIGLALLTVRADYTIQQKITRAVIWLGGGALTLGSYFYQYSATAQMPTVADVLGSPLRYVEYTLTYLGAAPTRGAVEYAFGILAGDASAICNLGESGLCSSVNTIAIAAGAVGLGVFMLAAFALLRRQAIEPLLAYLGLGTYALAAGALTSLGRASYGNHQALAQRYATSASLFWIALVALLALYAGSSVRHPAWRAGAIGLIVLFSLSTALCTLKGPDHFRWQYEYLAPARNELLTLDNDDLLRRLYPDPALVRNGAVTLKRYHLSVFR